MNAQAARWERPRLAGSDIATHSRALLNPRLRKELRLVAPYFFGMLLNIAMIWIGVYALPDRGAPQWLTLLFPIFAVVGATALPVVACAAGVISFSSEFQNGTLGQLLVQPVNRRTLWFEKFTVTAIAIIIPTLIAYGSFLLVGFAAKQDVSFLAIIASPMLATAVLIACVGPSLALRFKRALPAVLAVLGYILLNLALLSFLTRGMVPFYGDDALAAFCIAATCINLLVALAEYCLAYRGFLRLEV